jgi:hypothetical protein
MKKVTQTISSALLIVCLCTASIFATTPTVPAPKKTESAAMQKLININLMMNADLFYEKVKINIDFMINENNEVVVTATNNQEFDASLKQILNYKKIGVTDLKQNQIYTIVVSIQ